MGKYYITTTLPYVNAEPHIGFAMEIVRADVMARLHRALGDDVFFNTGTDEHGQKIYQKAVELGIDPQKYCDESAAKFSVLKEALNLSYNSFVRTTDEHHIKAAQEFWKLCDAKGDIYKKNYKIKYCVGCELEKTDSDLVNGKCPIHPQMELEIREEENYFFRFSNYQERLLELYKNNPDFVQPDFRQNEMKIFVGGGLQDFSISRLKAKMPWGVEVPGDSEQVMFVWFDALVNYISSLGWPENKAKFKEYWPGVQICGKDNLRQQTAMWQAMLMSAGLPTSKQIVVEGFITSGGAKMSKSLGNVIDPLEYVEKYGTDAVRYFLTAELSVFEDSDITKERFEEAFQASLANGIGNLCARVAAMSEKEGLRVTSETLSIRKEVLEKLEKYRFDEAMALIWEEIKKADGLINQRQVWKLEGEKKIASLNELVKIIRQIGVDLVPFMPATSEKIMAQYGVEEIKKAENLFARLS
ncbi:TPA: methionine--tRNA ligase [Candidatus Collierbacteria bacterium]|uniref:Methionine--tRNA ligase n=1 Tax=Candidatus Collierbacteria bacterium GW2011_GWA2_42_17 TaxID=1618378 RepID=A0A0G0Z3U9_9BACT|nr:MAG: Methionine-tRNA ligase [Candidatus Collierbacteria bacterium GW2011_GWB2_42_12]KKS43417.1 MAG: Methionine-tRNA ligase [Candidatus Collierbacteria bacterium GW2011_GWA2_42_17]KKS61176.1 MAG: Methionine-tRNA ligase [Candidatus Collierbacteria bacterium GW2011_GWE2_42_48]HAI22913.1 methionine--tRNA ligase [Candidatus Collierbacteria bacterium]HAN22604.1 methionine--tRNA ligase [Candidatus Collierbacteria bacterium]